MTQMSLQTSPFFNLYDKRVEEVEESFEEHDEVLDQNSSIKFLAHLEYVKSEAYKNETKFTSVNATGRISIRTSGHNFFTEEPNIGNMSRNPQEFHMTTTIFNFKIAMDKEIKKRIKKKQGTRSDMEYEENEDGFREVKKERRP
ncbi:unnamed protein product [Rhizophagus irregularis]|nr:unnamed protein product [Rhizophagus irregularis]